MNFVIQCNVCFCEYEETRVPKVLECGHSVCFNCLASILRNQRNCPDCRATLSRSIDEYSTNYGLLSIINSFKEKRSADFDDAVSLENMTNKLKSMKKILEELMTERDSIKGSLESNAASLESNKDSMQKLLSCVKIIFPFDQIEDLVTDIEECFAKVNSLNDNWEAKKDLLLLQNYENSEQYMKEIIRRLRSGKRLYACKRDDLSQWKYGEVTISERENRLHIHCLFSSEYERDASLMLLKDVKNFISKRESIHPFIEIGSQKLCFLLIDNPSVDTLRCLKLITGEEGNAIKGCDSSVGSTEDMTYCGISIPKKKRDQLYEDSLYQKKSYAAKEGEVTLQCEFNSLFITKIQKDKNIINVVGKLHKNYKIDFDKVKTDKKKLSIVVFLYNCNPLKFICKCSEHNKPSP